MSQPHGPRDPMIETELSQFKSEYVTVTVGGQMFGLPIARVQDVFVLTQMTQVSLAPDDIAEIINLRGGLLPAIDTRQRLGLGKREQAASMAVGIDSEGESYGLIIHSAGEALNLGAATAEPAPINLAD